MFLAALVVCLVAVQVSASNYEAQPYKFGYSIKDIHGKQHREETSSGPGSVKGSYGFTDENGIHRQVEYVADQDGFRAHVKTNEPGTAKENPAAVLMSSTNHQVPSVPNVPNAAVQQATLFFGNAGSSKNINHGLGLGQVEGFGGYGLPGGLNAGFGGVENFNGGFGVGNLYQGFGDLLGVGLGYQGMSGSIGNMNGFSGNKYQGMNIDNLKFGGYSSPIRMSGLLGGSLGYNSDGKYNTPLVGGNVRGFDSRYANLYNAIYN